VRIGLTVAGLFLAATTIALAKDPPSYDKGLLVSMNSSACGTAEKGSKTVAGEILGTDGEHKNTEEVLCQEYILRGNRILYHIRPVDTKHPKLLPVGDNLEYRLHNDKTYILDREGDTKEREYNVISMEIRSDADTREAKSAQ
jgi:hypothetical protein